MASRAVDSEAGGEGREQHLGEVAGPAAEVDDRARLALHPCHQVGERT